MIKCVIIKQEEIEALIDAQKLMGSCASPTHQKAAELIGNILSRYEKNKAVDFKRQKKEEGKRMKQICCASCVSISLRSEGGRLEASCTNCKSGVHEIANPKRNTCTLFKSAFKL